MQNFSIPVKIFSIDDVDNPDFLKVRLEAISEGLNRHNTFFTLESMQRCKDTFRGKPLLCAYKNMQIGDGHNADKNYDQEEMSFYRSFIGPDAERCVGYIPENSNITIEKINGKNWIVLDAIIFKRYNYELAKDILRSKNRKSKKISVEILSNQEQIEIKELSDGTKVEYLNDWEGIGCTILGDKKTEAIPGAKLLAYGDSEKYRELLAFACNNMEIEFMSKEEYGTGEKININRDKISDTSWGDIDKTSLRNKALKAKNYKELINFIYMEVEPGWEDAPSEKLKYPVAQISGNEAFYNKGGLSSAKGYAQTNNPSLVPKIERIQNKFEKEDKDNNAIEISKMNGVEMVEKFDDILNYMSEQWDKFSDEEKSKLNNFISSKIVNVPNSDINPKDGIEDTNNVSKGNFVPDRNSYDVRWFVVEPENKFMTYGLAKIDAGGLPIIGNRSEGLPAVLVEPDGKILDINKLRLDLNEANTKIENMEKELKNISAQSIMRKFCDIIESSMFAITEFSDIEAKIKNEGYCDEATMLTDLYAKIGEKSVEKKMSTATYATANVKQPREESGWKAILKNNGIGGNK